MARRSWRALQSQYWMSNLATSSTWFASRNFPLGWGSLGPGSSTWRIASQALLPPESPLPPSSPNTANTLNPPFPLALYSIQAPSHQQGEERETNRRREREGGGRTNLLGVELGSGAGGGDGEERESGGGCHGDSGEGGGGDGGGESRRRGEKEDHKKLENDPFFEGSLGRLDDKEWESRAISSGRPQPDTWTTTRATPALVDGRLSTRTLLAARVPKSTPPRVLTTMPARPLEIWLLIRADLRVAPVI